MSAMRSPSLAGRFFRIAVGILLLGGAIAFGAYLMSPSFHATVTRRLVARLEQATGGRVELGSVNWNLSHLSLVATNVTIHGSEPAGEQPLFHADRVYIRARVLSILRGELGLRDLEANRPVINFMVAPGGNSNLPSAASFGQRPIQQLFQLGVEHVRLSQGEVIFNDRALALDLTADGVLATLDYKAANHAYAGTLHAGKLDGTFQDFRPIASALDVQFSLQSGRIEVSSLKLTSEEAQLQASGAITNLANPKLDLAYHGRADLAQLGRIVHQAELHGGEFQVSGTLTGSVSDFSSRGELRIHDLDTRSARIEMTGINVVAPFVLTPTKVVTSHFAGNWQAGTFSGDGTLNDWAQMVTANGIHAPPGTVRLKFDNVSLKNLAATMPAAGSLKTSNLSSLAQGTFSAEWRAHFKDVKARWNAKLQAPATSSPGTILIAGQIAGDLNAPSQRLKIANADLFSRNSALHLSGELGTSQSYLQVHLVAKDLAEWLPLLTQLSHRAPSELHGSGRFDGTISGRIQQPEVTGIVQAENLIAVLAPASSSSTQSSRKSPRDVRFDSLRAGIEVGADHLRVRDAQLRTGQAAITFSGFTELDHYTTTPQSKMSAEISVSGEPVNNLQALAGTNFPITGVLNLAGSLRGSQQSPNGQATFTLGNGKVSGVPYKSLSGDLAIANQEVSSRGLRLSLNGAHASASGRYNLKQHAFQFQAEGSNFDLAHISPLQRKRLTVAGTANFQINGSGTLELPKLNAKIAFHDLAFNDERAGDLDLEAITVGSAMKVTGRSNFSRADVHLEGSVQLRDLWPTESRITFTHLDVDPLLHEYLQGHITEHSSVDGVIEINGPLRDLNSLGVTGEIQQASINVENIKLQAAQPIRFSVMHRTLDLTSFHIVGEGTDFTARGTTPLISEGTVNMRANGSLNLRVLEGLDPNLVSSGAALMELNITGDVRRPTFLGTLRIQNAGLSLQDLPTGLSDINGTMVFNEDRLQIQALTAHTGGGVLNVEGYIAYVRGLYFSFSATGSDIRLRYPPGVSAAADASLKFQGTLASSLLSGDVRVTKLSLNQQFDFGVYLTRLTQPSGVPRPNSPLNTIHLDVHVMTAPQLQVVLSLAKLSGDADFHIRGTLAAPVILGRVDINQGQLSFNGTTYQVDRGDILFINPIRIEPIIDVQLSARVRDYDVTLMFHGTVDKLSATYRSDPPLPSSDIIALLALGHTRQDELQNLPNQPTLAAPTGSTELAAALNAVTSSRVQRLFGLSRIKIDPIGNPEATTTATQADRGPTVTVEQQVSNRITLTYISNLAQSAQQVIEVVFQVNRNVSLDGIRDQNDVLGFDLKIRQRKR